MQLRESIPGKHRPYLWGYPADPLTVLASSAARALATKPSGLKNAKPMLTLDEISRDPTRAAEVPSAEKSRLIAQCAAIVMALTRATSDMVINAKSEQVAPMVPEERLLTVDQVAAILGFASSYVYELLRRGEIRGMHHGKYWRIRRSEVEKFIAKYEGATT
jgi:excisionase family DNA binding protein